MADLVPLKDVQDLTRDTISAFETDDAVPVAYFASDLVVADVGLSRSAIAEALAARGFAVIVDPPIVGKLFNSAPGTRHCSVLLMVHVQVNPRINDSETGAGVDIAEALQNVFSALIRYSDDNEIARFDFDDGEDLFHLVMDDASLIAYVVPIYKMVVFN